MMGLQEVVSWYQKKIGTYDKQQWERTVEQRILHRLSHVPKKTAKLKTELIDVDLVRGSSFPKAKPKHGLLTVIRLSLARLLFLPVYRQWWIQQTSPRVFALLLVLFCLQSLNMVMFTWCSLHMAEDVLEHVSASEVLVPTAMMMALSFLHSQIVAPHTAPSRRDVLTSRSRSSRVKRVKRRVLISARSRTMGSDSKSSPDTGSDKTCKVKESLHSKFSKRVRMRRGSDDKLGRVAACEGSDSTLATATAEAVSAEGPSPPGEAAAGSGEPRQRVRLQVAEQPEGEENRHAREITPLDDDGFESLNGNGSSENGEDAREEDNEPKPSSSSIADVEDKVSRLTPSASQEEVLSIVTFSTCTEAVAPEVKGTLPEDEEDGMTSLQSLPPSDAGTSTSRGDRDRWVQEILTSRHTTADSETDGSGEDVVLSQPQRERASVRRRGSKAAAPEAPHESSFNSSCESEDVETISSPGTGGSCPLLTEGTTSAAEWIGVTTNSEECSYSSEPDESDSQREVTGSNSMELNDHPFAWEFELSPTIILNPSCAASDKVSCTVWEKRDPKKADLSVLDISSAIIARVESMPETMDYFYGGAVMAVLLALLPSLCRLIWANSDSALAENSVRAIRVEEAAILSSWQFITCATFHVSEYLSYFTQCALGNSGWERTIILIAMFERGVLAALFFFLLAVAERTFKQRFLYSKLFSHLTSFRRARKSDLPHFRLNKVRNIKTWLSVRSYLKRRGPQRSVDIIVSAAFLITLLLLSFLSVECLKDAVRLHSEYNLEALTWCLSLGFFLLRFMTLGTKINRKYRNLSVLITEQINLYLQIEQKPNKKEELMVANSVLKLAADLLKELESPFKISGLSANPYLYTITKVVILSALSGVLSEMLGFKLKLHKIKIK